MKILFIGDIVARPGRGAVNKVLLDVIKKNKVDFVIANAENLAHGRGATVGTIEEMQNAGVNFFTGGDHLFWHHGFENQIDGLPLIRPANLPEIVAGEGHAVVDTGKNGSILIINIMGQTFVNEPLDNPFTKVTEILDSYDGEDFAAIIVDFHAEATSDKYAMGFYLDGKVTAVLGTHTHVPTCDERVFEKGTMYVTDVGMTGNIDSVLGVKKEIIIDRAAFSKKQKFEWETEGQMAFRSVLLDLDKKEIKRVDMLVN